MHGSLRGPAEHGSAGALVSRDAVEEVAALSAAARAETVGAASGAGLPRDGQPLRGNVPDDDGMVPGQPNVLVRVLLRHLERTLTDAEANGLRDRIYGALHQGSAHAHGWALPT